MRKAIFTALFVAACAAGAFAQGTDYRKGDLFVGYSANFVDTQGALSTDPNATGRDRFDGVNVEGTYNLARYFGAQADFSFHQKTTDFSDTTGVATSVRARLTQLLGGVKVQDNATDARLRPFAHALVGVAHGDARLDDAGIITTSSDNGLALALGGGLDIGVSKHWDVRAAQVDYNPIRSEGETQHNIRLSFGVNYRF
jgi:opacity protein-like surface antigen